MQKPKLINNQIYHIYNRGVEKRKIFLDKQDYYRFIHDLYEFNDQNPVLNLNYYFNSRTMEVEPQYLKRAKRQRKLLVEILIFTLMPNHFHLLLRQVKNGGVEKFMQKLGTGYTMYFNKKYDRVGSLLQGRFKAVLVNQQKHFIHLPFYIHANPVELFNQVGSTINFLENYKWSSFSDYIGKKNFPSVIQKDFLLKFFGGEKEYRKEINEWLKNRTENLEQIKEITIE